MGYVMSELVPVLTSAIYQDELAQLNFRVSALTADNARQARQIARQSVRMNNLTRKLAAVTAENARLKAGQPKPASHRGYTRKLGVA